MDAKCMGALGWLDSNGRSDASEFRLAAWTPGSYLVREYCRHVDDFAATTLSGEELTWEKTAKNQFAVAAGEHDAIVLTYSVYAHELTVRTSDLTDQHAFLVGAELFLWPAANPAASLAADVTVSVPVDWRLETQLPTSESTSNEPGTFHLSAEDRDALIDGAILAGELDVRWFEALGKRHAFVLDGMDGVPVPDTLIPDTITVIEQAAAIFGGELPYEEYRFLSMFTDAGRGGLEHTDSTALLAPRTTFRPRKQYNEFLGLVAHEFFHVWNVKRMRPAELWDFDYEHENYTQLLWVAEGFTAYYDDNLCRRAGVITVEQYLQILGDGITELYQTPGRHHQSLAQASYDAWIRLYRPDENTRNSTLSYYGNGALVALCLDLRIRHETHGRCSLDDVVRNLYESTFLEGRGYTEDDVIAAIRNTSGLELGAMIHALVHQPLDPDFATAFAPFGVQVDVRERKQPYLGVHFKAGTTTLGSVVEGGPAEAAGMIPGDELLAIEGLRVKSGQWTRVFEQVTTKDRAAKVLLARRGRIVELEVTPRTPERGSVTLRVQEDATEEQRRLFRGWIHDSTHTV